MKRKLNEDDVPTEQEERSGSDSKSFHALGLDPRLQQAIALQGFSKPTSVQSKAIPLALSNKDLISKISIVDQVLSLIGPVRSQTGSGKTAAFALPIIQSVLRRKVSSNKKATSALILVPTRELAQQISKAISSFTSFCSKDVKTVNVTQKTTEAVQRTLLGELPDIVVATPASAARNLSSNALSLESLTDLVIDEADLVLSYGYEEDLRTISATIPNGLRTSLVSATLAEDITTLKGLFCRDPVLIDLQESSESGGHTAQYTVKCAEEEKFLLSYVMFKLKLIKGKCIIFVGDIDRCYRLKLFLEQFGIKSCVLNSELPVNSRVHVVEEFNKGVYEIIIASDEHEIVGGEEGLTVRASGSKAKEQEHQSNQTEDAGENANVEPPQNAAESENQKDSRSEQKSNKKRKKSRKEKEYGISRGIDFQNVSCVLNFDFPTSSKAYMHRIGRTARAGRNGMALSFIIPKEQYKKHKPTTIASAEHDEDVLAQVEREQRERGKEVKAYHFDMKQVDAFRYRMIDALRAVTRMAIREARTRELRQELIKSEKLKQYFEENPDDLHHLRHDGELRAARIQPHLRHVPDYLMPTKSSNGRGKGIGGEEDDNVGFVALRKETDNRIRRARMRKGAGRANRGSGKGKMNPLKTFKAGK